jgi:carbonic anhydrase
MIRTRLLEVAAVLALSASSFTALGQEQSPIDIITADTVYQALPTLQYAYGSSVDLQVINNGSPSEEATIRANLGSVGAANSLLLSGVTYNLLQFHFHAASEHLLNGHVFDMELHLVHQKEGSIDLNDLLVTGIWIEEGAFNATLDPIFSNLPPDPANPRDLTGFAIASLLPADLSSYRYDGSLTTPPFTEGVQWIVLNEPIEMSHAQIGAFETLFPDENIRHPQDLNGRIVLTDVVPEPGSVMLLAIGLVAVASRRRRHGAV